MGAVFSSQNMFFFYFLRFLNIFKDFIYLFFERGEGRGKERERNIHVCLPRAPPSGDPARNPGMYPDRESNLRRFAFREDTQLSHTGQGIAC